MSDPLIKILQADITLQNTEAIVNAANCSLLGGGGVDGAIHRAAGPELLEECRGIGGCPTGEARITKGYRLPAKYIIQTAGPVWRGGERDECRLLAQCYQNCLRLAEKYNIENISFPSISTGAYGFPIQKASKIALEEITNFIKSQTTVKQVFIVTFSSSDTGVYIAAQEDFDQH
ncbi:O-acetyl-ADP-ribose deacetylase [Limihaloglobus sulfuriphilus]|uniref:O-acetyl-ADP-ribose deacetylase n=1 Tax=Limihaloglobus sulfuriphilus TaxID=1851148 RepID=A0A1Q2MDW2_9BACT|nr:O-acetyl-ADP-ribose deacetylase [Limihaloglobus sulfuriphilus]AQQ70839.1 O-acetyl-ADP-ribose deacetylase [Limihaloglobus sulfuriphilus]